MSDIQKQTKEITSKLTLLYVEDDINTMEQFKSIFKLLFADVDSAMNGEEALAKYNNKQYDLIITDLTMPKMDGVTFISEVYKINPLQKIIVMTAHNTSETLKESIGFNVDGFLLKPVALDNLMKLLFKVCESIYYKNKSKNDESIENVVKNNLDASKAFFIVAIDKLYDIKERLGEDTELLVYQAVKEHLYNFGIEDVFNVNGHPDILISSMDKHHLENILNALQSFAKSDNYIILQKNNIKIYITLSYGVILQGTSSDSQNQKNILDHINKIILEIKTDEHSNSIVKMDISQEEAKKMKSLTWLQFTLDALNQNTVVPFYQPIVDIDNFEIKSYQVLARIKNGDDYILPKYFIDLSEKAGILENISELILKQSFEIFSTNKYYFSIDILDAHWKTNALENYLSYLIKRYNIDVKRVILDVQHYDTLKVSSHKTTKLLNLKKMGFKLALKSFGTNNINIELLSLLKPEYIKINQVLLNNSRNDKNLETALKFVLDYIHTTGIESILVGAEDQETIDFARKLGFKYAQGFYISKPSLELHKGRI